MEVRDEVSQLHAIQARIRANLSTPPPVLLNTNCPKSLCRTLGEDWLSTWPHLTTRQAGKHPQSMLTKQNNNSIWSWNLRAGGRSLSLCVNALVYRTCKIHLTKESILIGFHTMSGAVVLLSAEREKGLDGDFREASQKRCCLSRVTRN